LACTRQQPFHGAANAWGLFRAWGWAPLQVPEPNNLSGEEYCTICNSSQSYGTGWGWSDTECNGTFTSICKIPRECRPPGNACRVPGGAQRRCHRPSPVLSRSGPALPAAASGYVYVSPVTNLTYIYNTSMVDQRSAHKICNSQGSHLVAYSSLEEQVDVERYFIDSVGLARWLELARCWGAAAALCSCGEQGKLLERVASRAVLLQRTATHCNAQQRTATHSNAQQRTATQRT
jgi:hypothetical protein